MKEAIFVKQNIDKWKEFEESLSSNTKIEPDRLADLFIQITDDLSFSRTQYPKSETTVYLNQIASKAHGQIYKNKKEDKKRFITFWKYELPQLYYSAHKQLLYSFLIFIVAALIGCVSVLNDETFVRLILGDSYVNMTLENIKDNNPLAVYGKSGEADMFFMITFNNIRVSFMAFAAGILLSVGTGYLLFSNGLMVGAFLTFLAKEGFLAHSLLVVMLHGTLELSAIVIAGSAGFLMGNSILFPKTYSRLESFKKGAKNGLKIIVGLIPVFIMAGFIESFLTRYTKMHWYIQLILIGLSASFIIYYFIIYPIQLNRNATKTN